MNRKGILILGATSSIGRSLAQKFARQGFSLHLAARDIFEVERVAKDLTLRDRVPVSWSLFECSNYQTHGEFFLNVINKFEELTGVVVCLGELGDHHQAQTDFQQTLAIINSNYTGVVSILTHAANYLEKQERGFIIGLSSVAGDRGRQSNYIYGSAKGALHLFLQGLRNRLSPFNIQVLTVKPGFVDTKMTFGKPGLFLVASPERVAEAIITALQQQKNIVYIPQFWFWIMLIIRSLPETLFKQLKL